MNNGRLSLEPARPLAPAALLFRIHGIAAASQLRQPCEGHDYYQKKLTEGKTSQEAIRAPERRFSDVVYRQLKADVHRSTS